MLDFGMKKHILKTPLHRYTLEHHINIKLLVFTFTALHNIILVYILSLIFLL